MNLPTVISKTHGINCLVNRFNKLFIMVTLKNIFIFIVRFSSFLSTNIYIFEYVKIA